MELGRSRFKNPEVLFRSKVVHIFFFFFEKKALLLLMFLFPNKQVNRRIKLSLP